MEAMSEGARRERNAVVEGEILTDCVLVVLAVLD